MEEKTQQLLAAALADKKINQKAHNEMVRWLTEEEFAEFVPQLTERIQRMEWEALMDAFYRVVIFGTGGIRGTMDLGTNRINNYTIRWASQAYALYLLKYKKEIVNRGVAIAYDSRLHSEDFMKETARVLAANDITVHVFNYYRATPELSFAVRHLQLAGGIVITASHNPPEFNGYKVYDENGVQMLPDAGKQIEQEFLGVQQIKKMDYEAALQQGLIKIIGPEVDKAFASAAREASVFAGREAKIVYSPLHGVGSESVLPVLKELGFTDITTVPDQMSFDGNFPNVANHFPNPEFAVVYEKPIALAKEIGADIVIVSDPDADRLGIAVPNKAGEWTSLNGNQGAVLMGYFYMSALQEAGRLPKNPVVIKTSVTTELVRDIAEAFNAEVIGDLLVGFKFIGDRLQNLPPEKNFVFACEESVGYLFNKAYRDKGAETPAVVAAEMAAWCKSKNITPMDLLEEIYQKYGYYAERLYYRLIEGFGSFEQMNLSMEALRKNLPAQIGDRTVVKVIDRLTGEVKDPRTGTVVETRAWDKGDMLSFFFSDDERNVIHVRPSGTEPKMKYYTALKGNLKETSKEALNAQAEKIEQAMAKIFEDILATIKVNVY